MLKLSDLALRPDFRLGSMLVSPSRRLVKGPGGSVHVEPLIMQVFLLLIDARGQVVTRNELFDQVWGGVMVGDDSLNRAIARVRKIASKTAPGLFEIETIPRTGYRLTGQIQDYLEQEGAARESGPVSRRALVASGAAAVAAVGAGALWWTNRPQSDPRFDALMERGREAIRLDEPGSAKYFEQAVALDSRSAKALGLLAYSRASGVFTFTPLTGEAAQAAQQAARKALEIDANEPNALLALTMIQSPTLDRLSSEDAYRRILSIDPNHALVMRALGQFLHGVGRCRESLAVVERALAIEPLAPDHWARKAGRLWVMGRDAEADRVIDRAMQFWPSHRLVRLMQLMIYAFTGRARAALAIVEEEQANPIFITAAGVPMWRASLAALQTPTASTIAAAREASIQGSHGSPQIAAWAILVMSALGELDAAFDVANGFLLDRGTIIVRPRAQTNPPRVDNPGWRNTFGLFTPPTRAMRLDPRFKALADGLGLTDYWRKRGIGPDAFLMRR